MVTSSQPMLLHSLVKNLVECSLSKLVKADQRYNIQSKNFLVVSKEEWKSFWETNINLIQTITKILVNSNFSK